MRRALSVLAVAGALLAPAAGAFASGGTGTTSTTSTGGSNKYPGLGIRLVEAPKSLAKDPRAHVFIIDHLAPGTTIKRKVQVIDGTPYPLSIDMYAAGAQIGNGIWAPYDGARPNELSRWVSISPATLSLASLQRATVEVTIAVPNDASAAERYAVVWAQASIPASGSVHEIARAGVRVYLSVGPGGAPPVNFGIDSLTAGRTPSGQPEVLAQVHNTGGRAIDLSGTLRLSNGPGGLSAGPFPVRLGTTLGIGQSEPVTVLLDKALPAGPWLARIDLRSDLTERAAQGEITFPTTPGTTAAPVRAHAVPLVRNRSVVVPVAGALIGLIGLGLIVLLLLWRRRRDDEDDDRNGRGTLPPMPTQRRAPERLRARAR